ncbi:MULTISPECIES: HlyD family efflux transporter periplasmic adaptor subunit [unclassified Halomonas]|uniref:HlyD family efflux transporter periplasmic adaptor subunit n=1 Tax=unclassified Halomonas TaxID=2609666 RepID=UPI001966B673|nr:MULTISPECIES: HlyD family efflux transporter periplasmic adaptor subunit [unclassified Halomonas]
MASATPASHGPGASHSAAASPTDVHASPFTATMAHHTAGVDERADRPPPPLREDLVLVDAGRDRHGEPQWSIQDPVTNRFYRIGWLEFECLARWGASPARIRDEIAAQTPMQPSLEQVLELVDFLEHHRLLRAGPEATDRLAREAATGAAWRKLSWWLHHYLFFRLPLVRPQRFLGAVVRALPWLFSRGMVTAVLLLGLLGLVLVVRRWDHFTHAVMDAFSLSGMLSFACALVVAKACHELGHALVATRLGVKVAHMGVAFIVLWPMLYTDTGESWKLRRSRSRLAISSAGMLVELGLAGLATLGWVLTEPGAVNSALLYLATTSWVLSLAINASPFMRFDGYFVLTDLLDFPNLHERAGAQARVWLRRRLLGLDEAWPEPFPRHQRRSLVLFAFATWLYRLVLFLGIALAVYHLFFKALGIVLFAVEIAWFILMPVTRELQHWWSHRRAVPRRFRLAWLLALGTLLLLACLPLQTRVSGPGVLHAERELTLYSPFPARLETIAASGRVEREAALVRLSEPDIRRRELAQESELDLLEAELAGLLDADDGRNRDSATLALHRVSESGRQAARREQQRLVINAPFAGEWQRFDRQQTPGQWVATREPLGVLVDPSTWVIDAYVPQDEVHRLSPGARVRFLVEGHTRPLAGHVTSIGATRAEHLSHPLLAARHGGPLSTHEDPEERGKLRLERALIAIEARLDSPWTGGRQAAGQLHIDAERQSLVGQFTTWVASVVIRESGF